MDHEKSHGGISSALLSRRRFLQGTTLAMAAAALGGASGLRLPAAYAGTPRIANDIDIANFALTLEHLEAQFYIAAVSSGNLSGNALTYLTAIRDHEIAHVDALTQAITTFGGTPVKKQDKYNFGDLSSQASILKTAETLEGTGVGAYTGAAALITDKQNILTAAASIEQVESRHYATIRYLNGVDGAPMAFGPSLTMQEVLDAVQPFFAS